ncbi:MAG: proteasome subunit alpha [Nitrospira sp.]|nr:proteasome subunit alpha [Candidatus Manganitrophaceae bacterium]HIL34021.1 proteasome subunit alpha [Candidatus Manganitrophaceae bacterium]
MATSLTHDGDFWSLLKDNGYRFSPPSLPAVNGQQNGMLPVTQGTTILALKYRTGVLVAGDRRATAGTTVMHDRTDKVLDIDRHSVLAIAGVPATAFEIARVMEHTFKYYRRSQLQELSLEGKIRALSKLLKENIPMAMQGIGAVAPIYAAYDIQRNEGKIFFYDMLGAGFEGVEYSVSGSGSPAIRGVLHYQNRWSGEPLATMSEGKAIVLTMRLLETAAEFDSATGGVNRESRLYPLIKLVTEAGVRDISIEQLESLYTSKVTVT